MGQEHPEEEFRAYAESNRDPLTERLERVESLLEDLIKLGHRVEQDIGSNHERPRPQSTSGVFTPRPMNNYPSQSVQALRLPSSLHDATTSYTAINIGLRCLCNHS